MDTKLTLSLNEEAIEKAKKFAMGKGLSLSKLTELFYKRLTDGNYHNIEEFPISKWVWEIAGSEAEYKKTPHSNKELRKEWYEHRAEKKTRAANKKVKAK